MRVLHVVGARPNFVKAAPVLRALKKVNVPQVLVHTGQHYDREMSEVFFNQLEIPEPDINLKVGSGSHALQTAEIMRRFEPVVLEQKVDIVLVYGDVNSTLAAALVCAKLGIKVGHVESGLRSFDRSMPEEINRIVTDTLSDLLFTPCRESGSNLQREGVTPDKIHFVGNVMIDSLIHFLPAAMKCPRETASDRFALVTLHRPSNVDEYNDLQRILKDLIELSSEIEVVFPVHPRTRERVSESGICMKKLHLLDPLPYLEFLALESRATVVITDSGGVQEETTYLGIPCLTLRPNTERPITLTLGTNKLLGKNESLVAEVRKILAGDAKKGVVPPFWDGHAADRVAEILTA